MFFKLDEIILWKEFCRVCRKYVAAKCQMLHYSALIKILVKTWQIFWWHMANWILANYKKHRMWINLNMRKLYFSIRRESRQNLAIKCAQLVQSAPFPPLVTIAIFNLSLLHHVIYSLVSDFLFRYICLANIEIQLKSEEAKWRGKENSRTLS